MMAFGNLVTSIGGITTMQPSMSYQLAVIDSRCFPKYEGGYISGDSELGVVLHMMDFLEVYPLQNCEVQDFDPKCRDKFNGNNNNRIILITSIPNYSLHNKSEC